MAAAAIPPWQIDAQEYRAVCDYLGLTPQTHLYDGLVRYLAGAALRGPRPEGFSRYLAGQRLTGFRIRRLDPATKMFLPGHPLRHVLNGVVALHECDAQGYRELAAAPGGWRTPLAVCAHIFAFAANLCISLPWLAWQWVGFAMSTASGSVDQIAGRRVLITGVTRGLGRDLMLHCLEGGAEVIGIVRSAEAMAPLRAQMPAQARVTLLAADLAVPGALVAAMHDARISADSIDMVILSAAIKHDGSSVLSLDALRETFQVNVFGAVELVDWLCGAHDAGRNQGSTCATSIVLVSSMGRWHGMHFSGGYNASKAALSIWGESLDMELRQRGNRRFKVTIVEPGIFASGMTRQAPLARALFASRERVAARILAGALAGRPAIRPPLWFAWLTWALCLLGRTLRYRILARARPRPGR